MPTQAGASSTAPTQGGASSTAPTQGGPGGSRPYQATPFDPTPIEAGPIKSLRLAAADPDVDPNNGPGSGPDSGLDGGPSWDDGDSPTIVGGGPPSTGARIWGATTAPFRFVAHNRLFSLLLLIGLALRVATSFGYRPALFYNDTFEYVSVALHLTPYQVRPDGYSFVLRALEPAHSFAVIAALQHVAGLATALIVYQLVRRLGVGAWAGCLAALPVLLDGYQIELEQVILSDTLFTLLVVGAVAATLRTRRPGAVTSAAIGLLLAAAMVTRPAAVPVIVVVFLALLFRRVGWRAVAALLVALAVPLVAYGLWFRADHGNFALDDSTGIQLYGRVGGFADCAKIKPAPALAVLCPKNPGNGQPAPTWVWHGESPLRQLPGPVFTAQKDTLAGKFALHAIVAQPRDYLDAVGRDIAHAAAWRRGPYPNAYTASGWPFTTHPWPIPRTGSAHTAMNRYEGADPSTRVVNPYARIMADYQKYAVVRGPILVGLTALAVLGLFPRRRRSVVRRGPLLLVTVVGLSLALVPIFTVQLDYRYLMPSYPFLAAAAVLGAARLLGRPRGEDPRPRDSQRWDSPAADGDFPLLDL